MRNEKLLKIKSVLMEDSAYWDVEPEVMRQRIANVGLTRL